MVTHIFLQHTIVPTKSFRNFIELDDGLRKTYFDISRDINIPIC